MDVLDLQTMLQAGQELPLRLGILGAVLGGVASALVGGLIAGSSAKSTNKSNQAIAAQETEFNQASAREANELTDRLSLRATKSTEAMTASALSQAQSQFEQSQAFNERMSNTAYTRGVTDLKRAGLNPILAATRGVTTTPTVSGGPTSSGAGTGGSGTAARASQFRKVDAGLQALNSAAAVGRAVEEIQSMEIANQARRKYGKGEQADFLETLDKAGADMIPGLISKHLGAFGLGRGNVRVPVKQKRLPGAKPPLIKKPLNKRSKVKPLSNRQQRKNLRRGNDPILDYVKRKFKAWNFGKPLPRR